MEQKFGSDLKRSGDIYFEDTKTETSLGSFSNLLKSGIWVTWLLVKYTFQTYGALMLALFGFYYYEYVDINDELLMVSHICLFGSLICAILLVMHKTLEAD